MRILFVFLFLLAFVSCGEKKNSTASDKGGSSNKFNLTPYLGQWFDGENCNLDITQENKSLKISYWSGPCGGELKGTKLNENFELMHLSSDCNFKYFDNSDILNQRIGNAFINNKKELVFKLYIGDYLLNKGLTTFKKVNKIKKQESKFSSLDLKLSSVSCYEGNECLFVFKNNGQEYKFEWNLYANSKSGTYEYEFMKKYGSGHYGENGSYYKLYGKLFRVYFDKKEVMPGTCQGGYENAPTCTKMTNLVLLN